MRLILVRHGNTFAPGETPRMIGAQNDLPLVEEGVRQAERIRDALVASGCKVDEVRAGPLLRTRQSAEIIGRALGLQCLVDERLSELDYGSWSGLSNQEIDQRFGSLVRERWARFSERPQDAGWRPDERTIETDVTTLVADLIRGGEQRVVVLISSNGRLRSFLRRDGEAFNARRGSQDVGMATGRGSVLSLSSDASIKVQGWNLTPDDLSQLLKIPGK